MDNIKEYVDNFKNMRYVDFNIENFYSPANAKRYNDFLINYVFKYYDNLKMINDYYLEKRLNGNNHYAGIFRNNKELSCIIPQRQTLFDEMVCIHELTHLVSELKENMDDNSIYKEVIPYFNEYEYLKSIHKFFTEQYEMLRFNTAVRAAKNATDDNLNDAFAYINAYLILRDKEDSYNIKKLNKINATSSDLENKLILKGYTI